MKKLRVGALFGGRSGEREITSPHLGRRYCKIRINQCRKKKTAQMLDLLPKSRRVYMWISILYANPEA